MRVDATLTGLFGLVVAFFADQLSSLTGLTSGQEFAMAAFFVLYGLVVFILAAVPNLRRAGIGVVAANIIYTVAAIVAAGLVPMTVTGIAATLASGVYTAFFAWLQYLGVRRLARLASRAPCFRAALQLAQAQPVDPVIGVFA